MYEGELAFEREILISGCLCDCSKYLQKEGRMQCLGFSSQVLKLARQTGISVCIVHLSHIQTSATVVEFWYAVFKAHLAKISSHFAS